MTRDEADIAYTRGFNAMRDLHAENARLRRWLEEIRGYIQAGVSDSERGRRSIVHIMAMVNRALEE